MLRQLAFSVSADNAVGKNGKIAYRFKSDMNAFRWYTISTVLIAGYRTALELAEANVNLNATRREIVIVGRPCADLANRFASQNLCPQFAETLPGAIGMATLMANSPNGLQGFTIIGGASVLNELADKAVWELAALNSAMVTEFDHSLADPDAVVIKDDLIRRIRLEMTTERRRVFREFGEVLGIKQCVPYWITDYSSQKAGFWYDGKHLHINSTAGLVKMDPFDVMLVREERLRNVITVVLNNGKELEIRLIEGADISGLSRLFSK